MLEKTKGVIIEVDVCEFRTSPSKAPIKSKLELSSKKSKKPNLETITQRLERAAKIRAGFLHVREEKLQSLSKRREDIIRKKESNEECEKQEKVARLVADHEEVEKRRAQRQKEIIEKLQERHKKISDAVIIISQRKGQEIDSLKARIMEKLEGYEHQREKNKEERVKRLGSYHSKLAKAVQAKKALEEKKINEIATAIEKKQLHAKENREKRIQRVKMLAEEVAEKMKKLQEFVYESQCI